MSLYFESARTTNYLQHNGRGHKIVRDMNRIIIPTILLALLSGCTTGELTGAWRSRIQFSSGDLAKVKDLEFMYVFNRGGTMTESSNYDSNPPVPPAYGVWRALGGGRFEAKYLYYTTKPPETLDRVTEGWPPAGAGELIEHITVATDGSTFESTLELRTFDEDGHVVPGGGTGSGRAERICFEARKSE